MKATNIIHTFLFSILVAIAVMSGLSANLQQGIAHTQQDFHQTATTMAYQPPIGIPAPSFGIDEIAPEHPAAWPSAEIPGYYYIDNTHANATDTNNTYGYPEQPRLSIPEMTYPAGSYVEIHGGDYSDTEIRMDFNCTQAQPCWVRGTPEDMPKISGSFISRNNASYVIFEYLDFDGGTQSGWGLDGAADHVAFRHSVVHNKTYVGHTAGIGFTPAEGSTIHDIVVYNNLFQELGDWQTELDQDFHGISPSLWGRDESSGSEEYNIWILENRCHHVSGDCVQVNAGWGQGADEYLHHIYIGKNLSYENRQSGFATKQARDVIFSQNTVYGNREVGGQPGDGIVYLYNPDNVWILYNHLYDNNFGIRQASTDGDGSHSVYIIGNVIHDNEHDLDPCGHWGSPYGWGISLWYGGQNQYIVNNTIYNTRGGIELINGGDISPTFISNNIIANLNGMDYANNDPECGSFTVEPGKVEHLSTNNVSSLTVDHNLFAQTDNQPIKINGFETLGDYQAEGGQCANCLESDPLFVDAANANFNLQSSSPAIDVGIEEAVYQKFFERYGLDIRVDYQNQPRPQGVTWDMGAHESTSSEPTIVWPTLISVEPAEASPGQTVHVMGHGGYLFWPPGRYDESSRNFALYFDDVQASTINCYVNSCQGDLVIPTNTATGMHQISSEGGSIIELRVLSEATENVVRIGSISAGSASTVTVAVDVSLSTGELGAVTVEVWYDPSILDAIDCVADPTDIFDGGGCNVEFDNEDPSLDAVRLNAISTAGISGNLLMAEITFQIVGALEDTTSLDARTIIFVDSDGQDLAVTDQDGEIRAGSEIFLPLIE